MNGPGRSRDRLELLRQWSKLLDNAFRIPGTQIRFGLDPLLGIFPGLGDLLAPAFSALLLVHATRSGVPRVIQVRILVNALVDALAGSIPVLGDVFDLAWKANVRNLQLVERHAGRNVKPTMGDWMFLWLILAMIVVAAAIPIAVLIFVIGELVN